MNREVNVQSYTFASEGHNKSAVVEDFNLNNVESDPRSTLKKELQDLRAELNALTEGAPRQENIGGSQSDEQLLALDAEIEGLKAELNSLMTEFPEIEERDIAELDEEIEFLDRALEELDAKIQSPEPAFIQAIYDRAGAGNDPEARLRALEEDLLRRG